MGRKGHVVKSKQTITKKSFLNKNEKELDEHIDNLLRLCTIPNQCNIAKLLENQEEIYKIINKINNLQQVDENCSVDNRASGAIIGAFSNWFQTNGAELNGGEITHFDGYDLGIRVNTVVPKSSLVIAVPRKLMLSIESANQSILSNLISKDQILKNMPNVVLAIFLLIEKFKENSFWKPYLDILPKKYTTVLYFTIDELEELKGSPTLEMALRQIKNICRQYAYFYKLFSTTDDAVSKLMKGRFTFVEYCWAVSTVMTRQNTIPSENGDHMINALIPLWDLCNHTNGTISTNYNPELNRSECLALRDFNSGEQLFIFYGARSNADLFIHNGFVYENNEHDSYWIRLGISKSDPLQNKRIELLKMLSLSNTNDFFIKKATQQPIDGKLLAFLRIFNMNEEQLEHWLENGKSADLQYIECALDTTLEKKAWTFLQTRLKLLLTAYKTTTEEDKKLLVEDKQMTPNKQLAIRMRLTEKLIINDTLNYVDQYIRQ